MSYSKIEIRYHGDGISLDGTQTKQGVQKKVTLSLNKKVQTYGDQHGYDQLTVSFSLDHVIIYGGGNTLMDTDINAGSREYISRIDGYDWLNADDEKVSASFTSQTSTRVNRQSGASPWYNKVWTVIVMYIQLGASFVLPWILLDWKWYSTLIYCFVIGYVFLLSGSAYTILARGKDNMNRFAGILTSGIACALCFLSIMMLPTKWWIILLTHIIITIIMKKICVGVCNKWGSFYTQNILKSLLK